MNRSAWILILAIAALTGCLVCQAEPAGESTVEQPGETSRFSEEDGTFRYSRTIEVTAGRPDDPHTLTEMPAFITVIRLEPGTAVFRSLPELLSGAVGVTVKDFGGLGKLSTVSIRGSSANQVVVLMDGIRINTASDAGVDLSTLPLDAIESVEILRGADSAVFGSGAMGGVVNLVTRKETGSARTTSGSLTYGSYQTLSAGAGTWADTGNSRYRVNARYQHTEGDFTFLNDNGTAYNSGDDFTDTRRNNGMDSVDAGAWFRSEPSDEWILSGGVEGFYADKGIPGLTTFPSEHAMQTDRRLTGHLRAETIWPDSPEHRFFTELQGGFTGLDFTDPQGEQTGVPVNTRQRTFSCGGRAGWDFSHTMGNGGLSVHYSEERLSDDDFGDPSRSIAAVAGRHDMSCIGGNLWLTTLLRYDEISDDGGRWSPKAGVRWFLSEHVSVKVNSGAGFRSPSFNELYMEMGYISGNPDLEPEESLSYDAGITCDFPRWRIEMAAFRIDSDNLIQYQLLSGFRYKPFNIGRAQSQGIELDASVTIVEDLTLSGSWTWDRAVDRTGEPNLDGRQIPGRPEHDLFARIDWRPGRLSTWMEWHYLSGNFVTRSNTKELDDRSTGNAGVAWEFPQGLSIGAEVKNLTDDRIVDVRGFPLPPRTFFVTVKAMI